MMRDRLSSVSAAIGSDMDLVQGQGGNTSVKDDGVLYVKASGMKLEDALTREIFVEVDLARCRGAVATRSEDGVKASALSDGLHISSLRPSIETSMHAMMPHPVVIHAHPVNTIAWAVQNNRESELSDRLAGLNWCAVPYARPGLPLTEAIISSGGLSADIHLLENHGLTVCAKTPEAAAGMLEDVERRLSRRFAYSGGSAESASAGQDTRPNPLLERLCASGFSRLDLPFLGAFVRDHERITRLRVGSLYPDHTVFLGVGVPIVEQDSIDALLDGELRNPADWFVVPEIGAFFKGKPSDAVEAMLNALVRVAGRLEDDDDIRFLSDEQNAALLNWDMEKYRQALAGTH